MQEQSRDDGMTVEVPRSWIVTPSLFLGEPPPWDDVVEVENPGAALAVIESGSTAVLPLHAWDGVRVVLRGLGLAPALTEQQITTARPCSFA